MKKLSKKNMVYIGAGLVGLVIIVLIMSAVFSTRRSLKSQCMPGVGMDCACFANVIDNRLGDKEISAFARFSKELRVRPNANILEFTDEVTARNISVALAVCRPVQQVPADAKNSKKK